MAAPGADSSFARMSNACGNISSRNGGIYTQTINQAPAAPVPDASAIPAVGFDANSAEFNVGRDNMAGSQNILGNNNRVNITNHTHASSPLAVYADMKAYWGVTEAPTTPPRPSLPRSPPASPNFVGREPELKQLNRFFFGDDVPVNKLRVFTVTGIGGCGKTQLVRRFMDDVYLISEDNPSLLVFYVDATTTATLQTSLVAIARASGLEESSDTALGWMTSLKHPFFLYIDNADDHKMNLRNYFPKSNRARIVITTRLRNAQQNYATGPNSAIRLGDLGREHSMSLLRQTACLEEDHTTKEVMITLVQELHCYALAIAQAGAAIFQMQWTVVEYLAKFRQLRTNLMDGDHDGVGPRALDDYHSNVHATWRLSYNQLSPPAAHLLGICAHFHHTGITEESFQDAFGGLSSYMPFQKSIPWDAEEVQAQTFLQSFSINGTWDVDKFRHCIQEACSFSLLSYDITTRTYSLHPLIHDGLRSVAPHPSQSAFLLAASTSSRWGNTALLIPLVPHIQRLLSTWKDWRSNPLLALDLAEPFHHNGDNSEKEPQQRAALTAYPARLTPDDWLVSAVKSNLCRTLHELRQLNEADPLQREVLDHRRRLYGEDDPYTIWVMSNLAKTLQDASRYDEAEKYYRDAVEKVWTAIDKYRDSIWSLACFAGLLCDLGRAEEAERTVAEAVETCRRARGDDDVYTLHALRSLGWIISQARGRYTEAIPLQRQAFEMLRRVLGVHHPETRVAEEYLNWTLARMEEPEAPAIATEDDATSTSHCPTSVALDVATPSDVLPPSDEPAPSTIARPTIHVPIPSPSLDEHSLLASTRPQDAGTPNRPHSRTVSLVKRVSNSLRSKSKKSTSKT